MKNKKSIIIIVLVAVLGVMAIGFALLVKNFTIGGSVKIDGAWDVRITSIEVVKEEGDSVSISNTFTDTSATFEVSLNEPGDYVEYKVTVTNNGSMDATLSEITSSVELNTSLNGVIYSISGITEGEQILKKTNNVATTKDFLVRVTFDSTVTTMPSVTTGDFELNLKYVQ